ncbi:hypothetical protein [Carnobacterium funditum]|uniref:hypothetical protein n=1 Tax=Carnobacterium funditum TaxID=2752 RepID=UPI00054E4754|nr:hypothetical protein [Carnobacterium funditum]
MKKTKVGDSSFVEYWFLINQQAVERMYDYCQVSHLTTAWNRHAAKPITNEEAEQFLKEKGR